MNTLTTPLFLALFALCALLSTARADSLNGGSGTPGSDPPLIVDADWYATAIDTPPAFYWNAGPNAPNIEGPFTFNAAQSVKLDVTDDFATGDRFEVFDFGVSLGFTSISTGSGSGEVGPQAAFLDSDYSSGSFLLPAGAHSITINAYDNPFGGGRGYLRALTVPEPTSLTMALLALVGAIAIFRR